MGLGNDKGASMALVKLCEFCNQPFEAKRKTKKFCSNAHRVAFHRLSSDLDDAFFGARFEIKRMAKLASQYPHLQEQFKSKAEELEKIARDTKDNPTFWLSFRNWAGA